PVIAYKSGGALETIIEGETGEFFEEQTWESLADTVIEFHQKKNEYNPESIKVHAEKFDTSVFKEKINDFVNKSWQEFSGRSIIK
ncbi:glycosyltransferase, partial [bacterium]|nr:glycosyltransferase [bacterium]